MGQPGGLLLTRPQRIAADLLRSREDPGAVAQVAADALRRDYASPGELAAVLAPGAAAHGFRRGDGAGLLEWLLDLTGDPDTSTWTGPGLRARTARTVTAVSRYATPTAFRRALTDRLKTLAGTSRWTLPPRPTCVTPLPPTSATGSGSKSAPRARWDIGTRGRVNG